ncbi:MAG TPA: hypothetical protein VFH47_08445 [Candidatus Thermoplasmatota archaeon]|nr:hypothetical protein [Candidatus Thermoplasmatota archaeon]
MGTELRGHLLDGRRRLAVRADFASDRVRLTGSMDGDVSYAEVEPEVEGTVLRLRLLGHVLEFEAGADAPRLAAKVRAPPSRLKQFGVRSGDKVALLDVPDADLARELAGAGATVLHGPPSDAVAGIVAGVQDLSGVAQAVHAARHARWTVVLVPRSSPTVSDAQVRDSFASAGLSHVKTLRFSATHTALRFTTAEGGNAPAADAAAATGGET